MPIRTRSVAPKTQVLFDAAESGNATAVKQCLKTVSPNATMVVNGVRCTALHRALENGRDKVVRALLDDPRTDPNQRDSNKRSPLEIFGLVDDVIDGGYYHRDLTITPLALRLRTDRRFKAAVKMILHDKRLSVDEVEMASENVVLWPYMVNLSGFWDGMSPASLIYPLVASNSIGDETTKTFLTKLFDQVCRNIPQVHMNKVASDFMQDIMRAYHPVKHEEDGLYYNLNGCYKSFHVTLLKKVLKLPSTDLSGTGWALGRLKRILIDSFITPVTNLFDPEIFNEEERNQIIQCEKTRHQMLTLLFSDKRVALGPKKYTVTASCESGDIRFATKILAISRPFFKMTADDVHDQPVLPLGKDLKDMVISDNNLEHVQPGTYDSLRPQTRPNGGRGITLTVEIVDESGDGSYIDIKSIKAAKNEGSRFGSRNQFRVCETFKPNYKYTPDDTRDCFRAGDTLTIPQNEIDPSLQMGDIVIKLPSNNPRDVFLRAEQIIQSRARFRGLVAANMKLKKIRQRVAEKIYQPGGKGFEAALADFEGTLKAQIDARRAKKLEGGAASRDGDDNKPRKAKAEFETRVILSMWKRLRHDMAHPSEWHYSLRDMWRLRDFASIHAHYVATQSLWNLNHSTP